MENEEALHSSPVNMETYQEGNGPAEEEFNFDQNITVDDVIDSNNTNEVEDSGMEAGLDTDTEGEEEEEAANEVDNSLVVLDPEHVRTLVCIDFWT